MIKFWFIGSPPFVPPQSGKDKALLFLSGQMGENKTFLQSKNFHSFKRLSGYRNDYLFSLMFLTDNILTVSPSISACAYLPSNAGPGFTTAVLPI